MAYKLDMSMMVAIHEAFRRELEQVERIANESDHDPGSRLQAALGWELFKRFLLVHHQSEDDVLWPTLRAHVAEQPDRAALVDALEAEHAAIEPLLGAIDMVAMDPAQDNQRLGDIVGELRAKLGAHLNHEESDGLPMIDASLTPEEWQRFSQAHSERLRSDAPMYMPWLLNDATPQTIDAILGKFPPPFLKAFRDEWGPSYAALTVWSGHDQTAA